MYAARFWALHAGKALVLEKILEQALLNFLENQAKVDASWQLMNSRNVPVSYVDQVSSPGYAGSYYGQYERSGVTGMHITALFGLETVIQLLLDSGKLEVDPRDSLSEKSGFITDLNVVNQGQTPLSYAAEQGHERVVNLLLDTGKVDVNVVDEDQQTPISYAIKRGFESIVKLLLDTNSVDVNVADKYHQTPISYALERGYESIALLLLNTGKVDINYMDRSGMQIFWW
ncbi:hypothetical protein BOTNAR_0178g00170 [Botryotinia narcissicola]|uniref:Uncharacterized protein n=1 Tax=Botryotinia narcissicola TaxID=278944 RepID=A0A4Z1IHI0_9HELO|nr:hypothetical protein BOTNAR_0178g00170 [Botryotinia narcissicola]